MDGSLITEAELRKQLKGCNPVKVRVVLGDEAISTVAMSSTRNKWTKFLATLAKLGPWTKLECLDKNNDLLAVVTNEAEAADLEELGVTPSSGDMMKMERVLQIASKTILAAQHEVLAMRDRETVAMLQSIGSITKDLTGGMKVLQEIHAAQLEAAYGAAEQAALAAQTPAKDSIEQVTTLLEGIAKAAPGVVPQVIMLLKALGLDKLLPTKPAPAAKPNGAPPAAPPNGKPATPKG